MTGRVRAVCAVVLVVGIGGCTSSSRPAAAPADGWQRVTYGDAVFDVPEDWPVETPEPYAWSCQTYEEPARGVYLGPDEPLPAGSCAASSGPYGTTLHVGESAVTSPGPAVVTSIGGNEVWTERAADGTHLQAIVPHLGLVFLFYEVDAATTRAILASADRADPPG